MAAAISVRVAEPADVEAIAALRALPAVPDAGFTARMATWLANEGDRRTTWLATAEDGPAGMVSLYEYRRMPRPGRPHARWGHLGNLFVRADARGRGVGSLLLVAALRAADERGYVRTVLAPAPDAVGFFVRAGFVDADARAGTDRLLVRAGPGPAVRIAP